MKILIKDKKNLPKAAREFIKLMKDRRIFAFYGPMGAGKTTIIKSICQTLGAVDIVTSPTFTLVNEYRTENGQPIFHIDFYRIRKIEEVFDFGIEEYLAGGSYCFMEWPELVEGILPGETVRVRISVGENDERLLTID